MLKVIKGDITTLDVDAIVNAANEKLSQGGGVCGAIFAKCGDELVKYCNRIRLFQIYDKTIRCKTGFAIITPAFGLSKVNNSIRYIIHAVGPIYQDGKHNEAELLKSAYVSAINEALSCNVKSIAFPFISSGIYGYPTDECAKIAMTTLYELSLETDIEIIMCAFSNSDTDLLKSMLAVADGSVMN